MKAELRLCTNRKKKLKKKEDPIKNDVKIVAAICSILLHLRNSYFRNIIIVSCLNRRLFHKWTEFLISDFFYVALISLRDFANVCKRPRMVAVATS